MEKDENPAGPPPDGLSGEQAAALGEMCRLLARNADGAFLMDFFAQLFTGAELREFARRWLLVRALDGGMTQREIAQKYRISLCKITRGSRELKKPDSAFRRLLDAARDEP